MTILSLRSGFRLLLGLSLVAATSSAVLADVAATRATGATDHTIYGIQLNNISGTGQNLGTTLNQFYSKIAADSFNGLAYNAPGSGAEIRTFCVDLRHNLFGNPTTFTNAVVLPNRNDSALGDGGSPVYNRDLGRIGALLNVYADTIASGSNWTGLLSGLNAIQRGAALQAAVWAAGFGVGSFSITSGGTAAGRTAVKTAADELVTWSIGKSAMVGFIDYRPQDPGPNSGRISQDQAYRVDGSVITAVPEPSTFAIAGLGALAFAGYGLQRRREAGAAA